MIKTDGVDGAGQEIMRRQLLIIFHTMQAHGREIEVISPGMTAEIIVPDTLAEEMHLNWILEGHCGE